VRSFCSQRQTLRSEKQRSKFVLVFFFRFSFVIFAYLYGKLCRGKKKLRVVNCAVQKTIGRQKLCRCKISRGRNVRRCKISKCVQKKTVGEVKLCRCKKKGLIVIIKENCSDAKTVVCGNCAGAKKPYSWWKVCRRKKSCTVGGSCAGEKP